MTVNGLARRKIARLRLLLGWHNSRRNPPFLPVAILRMWDLRYAFKIEEWRVRSGPAVARWLRAAGEAEALSSLAGFAYENPTAVYPVVESGPVQLIAIDIGHPLIANDKCVTNDVTLGGDSDPRVLIVSGSNMSGKSTLLRAVGVNVVLALAGGTVRATSLTLTPVALGATMRVQDLLAGRSRFFAEVTKIRACSASRRLAIFRYFFFSMNSSRERTHPIVWQAEGVVRTHRTGAVGFVTTHDLSLTAVTEQLSAR